MSRPWQLTQALRFAQMVLDLAVLAAAHYLAFVLRFEGNLRQEEVFTFLGSLPGVLLVQYCCLVGFKVPQSPWRFVSLLEMRRISVALSAATVLLIVSITVCDLLDVIPAAVDPYIPPRGVIFLDLVLGGVGVIGVRAVWRTWLERLAHQRDGVGDHKAIPTLLIGAGSAGAEAVKQISDDPKLGVKLVGFLDDNPLKLGMVIHGVQVLGSVDDLKRIAKATGAKQAIITIGHPSGQTIQRIVDLCKKGGLSAKVIPGIRDILEGKANLSAIRDVAIDDLLQRDPVDLDVESIAAFINNRRILITGAGGSIGSELCRTVCRFGPACLVLVDNTENNLFQIHRELTNDACGVQVIPCLADVCDQSRMEQIFAAYRPEMVLHAAAYKHVPMIEWNPGEAIKNNIVGTRTVADLADAYHVGEFVMISTDKAVNPTSIMGASKRVAEIYIQALSQRSRTRFVAVRFGNVLGSAGSVIPTFKEQIARGGPVTVTHPEMKRYFMTIPEACQLVLQAATMGEGGEIFILDMGEPVKIVDLARNLIALSGFGPGDIEIRFTGIRPGEKLFEELALKDEVAQKTWHPKIFVGRLRPVGIMVIDRAVSNLQELAERPGIQPILRKLKEIVPEFEGGAIAMPHHPAWVKPEPGTTGNGKPVGSGVRRRARKTLLLNGVQRVEEPPETGAGLTS